MKFIFSTILLISYVNLIISETCDESFQKFIKDFNKAYKNDEEKEKHRGYFCDNLKEIEECKNNKSLSYTCGINGMTDQLKKTDLKIKDKAKKHTKKKVNRRVGYPGSLDWRQKNVISPVKDQEDCGSCWAFAAAASAQSHVKIHNQQQEDRNVDFSQQYLLDCTPGSDCFGGYMEDVMQVVVYDGIPNEDQFPYDPYEYFDGICYADGNHIASWNEDYYDLYEDEIIQFLQDGPVVVAISSQGWLPYTSGVFSCSMFSYVDHAVQLIGYTEDYWIIKNSWGTSWGEKGFMRITKSSLYDCDIGVAVHLLSEQFFAFVLLFVMIFVFM